MDKEIIENHKRYLERKKLNKRFGYDIDQERDFIVEQAKPLYGKILEAGTGKGHFALALAKQGFSFVTFDISEDEQRIAKMNLSYYTLQDHADFRVENGEKTSFADASFDVIFSVNVIHHLRDPYLVIDELIRILAPKGKMVLADFNAAGLIVMDKIHAHDGSKHEISNVSLTDIETYLDKKGFIIENKQSKHQVILIANRKNS